MQTADDEKARAIKFLHSSSVLEVEHTCLVVFVDYELKRFCDAAPLHIRDNDVEGWFP